MDKEGRKASFYSRMLNNKEIIEIDHHHLEAIIVVGMDSFTTDAKAHGWSFHKGRDIDLVAEYPSPVTKYKGKIQ